MLSVYEVTKILLGHGADGSVRRAYHRDTGTHRSRPRRTGQPLAPAMSVALSLEGKAAFPLPGVDASDGSGDRHALKYLSRTAYHGHVDDPSPDREVNVLKIFQAHPHPNVLRLLEVFAPSLPSRPHWVFATVEAETTLRAIIYKHNALLRQGDGAPARDFGRQILEGIRHMHRHRVIHRDLKPDNILVSFDLAVRSPAPSLENLTDVVGAHTWQARVQICVRRNEHRTDSAGASSSSGVEFADDDLRKLVVEQLQHEIDEYNKKIVRLEAGMYELKPTRSI